MYIPEGHLATVAAWRWLERLTGHVAEVLEVLGKLFHGFARWLIDALGFALLRFNEVSERTQTILYATIDLVHAHLFLAHVLAWSIFFGPIIILVPFLLMHEILILVVHNLTYTLHGLLLPGSLPDQYEALRLSLLDTRESLFSLVDRSSSVFNKWTSEHIPLMVLRLAGAALGSILLYAIWAGW